MKKRDYTDYLNDILLSIEEIFEFTIGMSIEQFKNDRKTINAVIRSLEVIGEASKRLPQSIKENYKTVPWKKIAGMRDKLIHEYSGVDYDILWMVIEKDLPAVMHALKESKINEPIVAHKAHENLRKLRGKVRFSIDLKKLRED